MHVVFGANELLAYFMAVDALTDEPQRLVTLLVVAGQLVAKDPDATAAHLDEVRGRHPELVRPGKTVEERTLLTARKAFARYGKGVTFESRGEVVFAHFVRLDVPRRRGTSRAVRSTRRVRTVSSSGDPPRSGDDDPDPDLVRICAVCGVPLVDRRPQTTTCSAAHRQTKSRRLRRSSGAYPGRQPQPGNGNSNGNGPLTPRELARLRDLIARELLRRAGGFERVERLERDLERATRKLAAAA
jgi:hypothetical protein